MIKTFFTLLLPIVIHAQVGINTTTPHASSMLEINATDKGLLLPRISISDLTNASPITLPATSLLVYNTNTTTGEGYYYWDGLKWMPFRDGKSNWTKTGNNLYNNNITGNVGIGTTNPTTRLHIEDNAIMNYNPFFDGAEDNTITPFTTYGNGGNWTITNTPGELNTGSYGFKSSGGVPSSSSILELPISIPNGGATMSFNYKLDCENTFDKLRLYLDDVLINTFWGGIIPWNNYNTTLAEGNHVIKWQYEKDNAVNAGLDRVFIDNINITSAIALNNITPVPLIKIVDGGQANGKVLTSDSQGNASWKYVTNANIPDIPLLISVSKMQIPICNNFAISNSGNFQTVIKGITTTVTWRIRNKTVKSGFQTYSGVKVANADIKAEKLQVQYDFSPPLPFNPAVILCTANNTSDLPDVFTINYAEKAKDHVTLNIARVDTYTSTDPTPCWAGQFYFDMLLTN